MPKVLFKKGRKRTGGRVKGQPNGMTVAVRNAIEAAATGLGGVERIIAWAKEDPANERVFWSQMYMRLLPVQLQGTVTSNVNVTIKREELVQRLVERGLSPTMFDIEVPRLIEHSNGNGEDARDTEREGVDE